MRQRGAFSVALFSQIAISASSAFPLRSLSAASASSGIRPRIIHMANSSIDVGCKPPLVEEYCHIVDAFGCAALEYHVEPHKWMRLEAESSVARDLHSVQDVYDRIQHAKERQSLVGKCELYKREWEYIKRRRGFFGSALLKRIVALMPLPWKGRISRGKQQSNLNANDGDETIFSVLQFNTLAEGLSAGPESLRPFLLDDDMEADCIKNAHGGFTNLPNPEIVLDFRLRRWRILEVLLEHSPDIMALQEVDRYHGFFGPILCGIFGYSGLFLPKLYSPGIKLGWYSDGCAFLFKAEKFKLIQEKRIVYKSGSQVGLLATLQHRASSHIIIVGVTHLKASASIENEEIRCAQVQELIEEIQKLRYGYVPETPVFLLGDFNSDRPQQWGKNDSVSAIKNILQAGYQSTYDLSSPNLFTTYKTRGENTIQRVIDYIFFQGLHCTHRLSIPKEAEMESHKLPGLRYPSDHLMIAGKFRLEPPKKKRHDP